MLDSGDPQFVGRAPRKPGAPPKLLLLGWECSYGGRFVNENEGAQSSFVHLAPVGNARDTDEPRSVVNDVHYAPVTDSNAPLIFVAFELLASCGPWRMAQSLNFLEDTGQHVIR